MTYLHIAEMDEKQSTTLLNQINNWNDNDANNDICCMAHLQKLGLKLLRIEVANATIYGLLTKRWNEWNESTAKFEPNGYLRKNNITYLAKQAKYETENDIYCMTRTTFDDSRKTWKSFYKFRDARTSDTKS